ncbi:hypothetical protein B0H13DRAFT_1862395 [Mycena leptocephala]|nr:hypothetical protein B0H13DRAFT_1862395 [Mycena leptocephala]
MHHETIHHRKKTMPKWESGRGRKSPSATSHNDTGQRTRGDGSDKHQVKQEKSDDTRHWCRGCGGPFACCRQRTPHMTADTTQGDRVYGNETDFREATGCARGVRWSDNDTNFPRKTRRACGLKRGAQRNDLLNGCGILVSIESPWAPNKRPSACALPFFGWMLDVSHRIGRARADGARGGAHWYTFAIPASGCAAWVHRNDMYVLARSSRIHSRGRDERHGEGGMRLRRRRARAVDDVSDARGCVVREEGVRMRMYGACVRVGCMGAAWKTENQPRREMHEVHDE